jgi:hypothetical protein
MRKKLAMTYFKNQVSIVHVFETYTLNDHKALCEMLFPTSKNSQPSPLCMQYFHYLEQQDC